MRGRERGSATGGGTSTGGDFFLRVDFLLMRFSIFHAVPYWVRVATPQLTNPNSRLTVLGMPFKSAKQRRFFLAAIGEAGAKRFEQDTLTPADKAKLSVASKKRRQTQRRTQRKR